MSGDIPLFPAYAFIMSTRKTWDFYLYTTYSDTVFLKTVHCGLLFDCVVM